MTDVKTLKLSEIKREDAEALGAISFEGAELQAFMTGFALARRLGMQEIGELRIRLEDCEAQEVFP